MGDGNTIVVRKLTRLGQWIVEHSQTAFANFGDPTSDKVRIRTAHGDRQEMPLTAQNCAPAK
jgi:hypothetical protein